MRVAGEIIRPEGKVSIFRMNNKYIIKIERGHLEQTFKINELDYTIADVADAERILDEPFMKSVLENFQKMNTELNASLNRNDFI